MTMSGFDALMTQPSRARARLAHAYELLEHGEHAHGFAWKIQAEFSLVMPARCRPGHRSLEAAPARYGRECGVATISADR
jgi:hypothetical protein